MIEMVTRSVTVHNEIQNVNLDQSLVEDVGDGETLLVGDLTEVCSPCVKSLGHPQLGERLHQACLKAGREAGEGIFRFSNPHYVVTQRITENLTWEDREGLGQQQKAVELSPSIQ